MPCGPGRGLGQWWTRVVVNLKKVMYLRCKGDDVIKIYGSAKAVNYYKTARLFLEITGCSEIWILGNCKIGNLEIIS